MTKEVAIVGLASETVHHALELPKNGEEVWSLNTAVELYPELQVTRMFDMHQPWLMKSHQYSDGYKVELDHWGWLQEEHDFPIYTLDKYEFIPGSVEYPFAEVDECTFGNLVRGTDRDSYFACSFNYMLGLAIYEKFERIFIYGFEMATFSEFAYQKAAAETMMGIAMGRDIKIHLVEDSKLMRAKPYGYTEAQMLTRRRLEQVKNFYSVEYEKVSDFVNVLTGRVIERNTNGKDITDLNMELQQQSALMYLNMGAQMATQKLIQELDESDKVDLTLNANLSWQE